MQWGPSLSGGTTYSAVLQCNSGIAGMGGWFGMIQIRFGEAVHLHCHPVVLGGFAAPFHPHPPCCRDAAAISGAHHCEHFPRAGAESSVGDSVTRFCPVPLTPVWR